MNMANKSIDIAVCNGLIVSGGGIERRDLLISGGKVAGTAQPGADYQAARTIDAAGKYLLPGIIDAHLHPVYADRMDTLSRAAAREGITTLIPYVGAVKAWGQEGGLIDSLDAFIAEGERDSVVDFSLHCTMMQADMEEAGHTVPALIERGITSFKGFMAYAKRGMKLEDRQLLDLMAIIAKHGGLFAAHAENGDIIDYMEDHYTAKAQEAPQYYPPSHPHISEAEAIFRLLSLAQVAGGPIYIPHISTAQSLDVVTLFKKYGKPRFYTETCPHYLCLNAELMERYGSLAKMAPPLRTNADNEALWSAVTDGRIEVVASDHAGSSAIKNEPLWEKVFAAPNGIPGTESLFKMMYQQGVNRGRITLPGLVRVLCENPARIFGLYPQKGSLEIGADADLMILDPAQSFTIPKQHPELKVDYSMYEGMTGMGTPVLTMQRGQVIFADGEIAAKPGQGSFLAAKTHKQ
jgi:dihydropyrimidinase